MKRDDVICWAREAGWPHAWMDAERLERFAALVAAAEREELARFFEDHWRETWTDLQIAEAIRARGQA